LSFPGETDTEFGEAWILQRGGVARIHVFSYSPRSGTAAAKMTGQVPDKVKKERSGRCCAGRRKRPKSFRESFAGEALDVIWKNKPTAGLTGINRNYIRVFAKSKDDLSNQKIKN